jgi:hypothetical protein
MKQACKTESGANRREVEKAWGRNEARMDTSRVVDTFGDVAKRAENPKQVELRPRGRSGRMSEGTLKRRRDEEG